MWRNAIPLHLLYTRVKEYLQSFFKLLILLAAQLVAHAYVSAVCCSCDSGSNKSHHLLVCYATANTAKSHFCIHQLEHDAIYYLWAECVSEADIYNQLPAQFESNVLHQQSLYGCSENIRDVTQVSCMNNHTSQSHPILWTLLNMSVMWFGQLGTYPMMR